MNHRYTIHSAKSRHNFKSSHLCNKLYLKNSEIEKGGYDADYRNESIKSF